MIYKKLFFNNKFIRHSVIGKSWCKRDINLFQMGNTDEFVLFAGAFHGSEWITALILIKFLNEILVKFNYDNRIKRYLEKCGIGIIPIVNPDGVEIALNGYESAGDYKGLVKKIIGNNHKKWQANARGVDINHNFNAGWEELKKLEIESGITSPASTRYGGEKPESENETKFLVRFCENNFVKYSLAFHSQGEEIYWKYGEKIPKKSKELAILLSEDSSYKLSEPEGLAIGGGFKDWFIRKFNRPSFTIEVGKGENPLPLSDLDLIYKKINKMFYRLLI
ncbi:MAG: zinc carboxypeptidase [Candidatus Improbicoccus pseudotrichonymphae]|uniref:Zinc carboxypeptidase n=1 Tax=Candidatus Improbicoccus pseudotrichonymphae TaxID=3033792 RepID=A0AA48HVN6_9FIRM|nr:MAG: zinc carboxypeptidase [Candidatus Improbicoccus pseudotrichonymphae]